MRGAPFSSDRRTIDVSGDGTNNAGRDAGQARDEASMRGITINGLAILSDDTAALESRAHKSRPGDLRNTTGTTSPVGRKLCAGGQDFSSFGQAIIKKLVAEIADAGGQGVPAGSKLTGRPAMKGSQSLSRLDVAVPML